MFNWWKEYKEKEKKKLFRKGYDFAAGMLLSSNGEQIPSEFIDMNPNEFDDGILKAERDWYDLCRKK